MASKSPSIVEHQIDRVPMRVMLADDHPVVRSGLRMLLEAEGDIEVVAETDNVPDTVRRVGGHCPDVLVLDLFMPGPAPIDAIPEICSASPGTRVLILTMHDDIAYVRKALASGASGFLMKDAADQDLIVAVRSVASGVDYVDPSLGARLAQPDESAPESVLTPREIEVVRLIAHGHTNREVAEQLFLSVRTVESHRSNIQEKVGAESRSDLVAWALQHNLVGG